MKKIIAIAFALLLSMSLLAACGGDNPSGSSDRAPAATNTPMPTTAPAGADTQDETDPASTADANAGAADDGDENGYAGMGAGEIEGQAMESLIAWMMDGRYSYDFDMVTEGPDGRQEGSGSWAQDGDSFSIRQEMNVEGQIMKSWIMQKDGTMYIIDEASQLIMEMAGGMDLAEAGMMTDYTEIELVGAGNGEINGKTLPYEEYREGELGATVKYYMDGGQVYGIESELDEYKTITIIKNPSNTVPSGAFDLPSGYTTMSF